MISQALPDNLAREFEVVENKGESEKNQIIFETSGGSDEPVIISDLIHNLEIVLA